MTKQERATLLDMAGRIAGGLAACGQSDNETPRRAVSIALEIFSDPRLEVTEPSEGS